MIYYLPIEPLEERYTSQWYRWFPTEFKNQGLECTTIDGETLNSKIETGTFLDINSTLFYKAEQLKKIAQLFFEKKIKAGDIFFIADIEFWGIESIKYLSVLNGIDTKIFGFCHAASYTREDFFEQCASFGKYYEEAWFNTFDLIFVGSEYHKGQMVKLRNAPPEKVIVSGNPYDIKEVKNSIKIKEKKNRVILTNRPDYEKRPNLTLDVFEILKSKHPDWEFCVTTGRDVWGRGWIREKAELLEKNKIITIYQNLSKKEYLSLLQESKVMVSNSIEENFGYCILEALLFDTIPILTNDYSHPELVSDEKRCLFNSIDEEIKLIEEAMFEPFSVSNRAYKYNKSLFHIVDTIKHY